jgi:hypothetical protein
MFLIFLSRLHLRLQLQLRLVEVDEQGVNQDVVKEEKRNEEHVDK